jgi:hypothetical protein
MRKALFLAVSVLLVSAPIAGAQHMGQNGLGVVNWDTPIGYARGINDKTVLHLGLGYDHQDGNYDQFSLSGQLNYDLIQHSGSFAGFGVAPAIFFSTISPDGGGDSASIFEVGLQLGGHWDPMDWVSFWLQHGLYIEIFSPGGDADSVTNFFTSGDLLGSAGFTFWF